MLKKVATVQDNRGKGLRIILYVDHLNYSSSCVTFNLQIRGKGTFFVMIKQMAHYGANVLRVSAAHLMA